MQDLILSAVSNPDIDINGITSHTFSEAAKIIVSTVQNVFVEIFRYSAASTSFVTMVYAFLSLSDL